MAEDESQPPAISISRISTGSSRKKRALKNDSQEAKPNPRISTKALYANKAWTHWLHTKHWQNAEVEWHIPWTKNCFANGRVLVIDYFSSDANAASAGSGKRHVTVAAKEFEDLKTLQAFYSEPKRAQAAALRVIHVQNATWATRFLLRKFNIDHPSEIVGMQGFSRWARYGTPCSITVLCLAPSQHCGSDTYYDTITLPSL